MKRIAVVSAILEKPGLCQGTFNQVVSEYKDMVRGRMGLPFNEADLAVVSLTIVGTLDQINALTGKLGDIPHVTVKTAISSTDLPE